MNVPYSNSFRRYQDLKQQLQHDLEAGTGLSDTTNLDKFFVDVQNVKQDMIQVEKLYKRLQISNQESKIIHSAKNMKDLRARMDSDASQVLKHVKLIKGKLEALERSNADNRRTPGCGLGSSIERTRTLVVSGLGKKLGYLMDGFQGLRERMNVEHKETVEQRYFAITGKQATEELIENLIARGETTESFLQIVIQEQGRGQIMDTISEIQERRGAAKEIEKNLSELHQIFLDVAELVEAQGQELYDIESQLEHSSSFARRGIEQVEDAREDY